MQHTFPHRFGEFCRECGYTGPSTDPDECADGSDASRTTPSRPHSATETRSCYGRRYDRGGDPGPAQITNLPEVSRGEEGTEVPESGGDTALTGAPNGWLETWTERGGFSFPSSKRLSPKSPSEA